MLMNSNLYNELIENIAYVVKSSLNEMAKNISHRTIDRKVWLSIASACSRNKATQAEFVKPMKKLTVTDLIERYVAALIIFKKSCPLTKEDIESLKTFKFFAYHALELGATLADIKASYNENIGVAVLNNNTNKSIVSKVQSDTNYIDILEKLIQNVKSSEYNKVEIRSYLTYDPIYLKCKDDICNYIQTLINKSSGNFDTFISLCRDAFIGFAKVLNKLTDDTLFKGEYNLGTVRRGYNDYDVYVVLNITKTNYNLYKLYKNTSFHSNSTYSEKCSTNDFLNNAFYNYDSRQKVNIIEKMSETLAYYYVLPYIKLKLTEQLSKNILNSLNTYKKYSMIEEPSNYLVWFRTNIKKILLNNPDTNIYIKYGDWSGSIEEVHYNSKQKNYYVSLYLLSGNSDSSDSDYLDNLLNARGRYSYRYVDNKAMKYVKDTDDAIYRCTIADLDEMAKKAYNNIKNLIKNGLLI